MKADVKSVLVCINLRFSFYINELFYRKNNDKIFNCRTGKHWP